MQKPTSISAQKIHIIYIIFLICHFYQFENGRFKSLSPRFEIKNVILDSMDISGEFGGQKYISVRVHVLCLFTILG